MEARDGHVRLSDCALTTASGGTPGAGFMSVDATHKVHVQRPDEFTAALREFLG